MRTAATKTIGNVSRVVKSQRANAFQLAGMASISLGGFVIATWLGLFITGGFLCLIGWGIDE